jgi:hypothetical protein
MSPDRKRLPTWAKIAIAAGLVLTPIVTMTTMLFKNASYKIDFARWETYGTQYLRPASRLLGAITRYDGMTRKGATRAALPPAWKSQLEQEIEVQLAALQAVDGQLAEALKTTPAELIARGREAAQVARIEAAWRQLRQARNEGRTDASATPLAAAVRTLISHVGDSSKLILDPDLDTYYVMDALLLREPEIIQRNTEIASRAADLVAHKALSLEERHEIGAKLALLLAATDGLVSDLETAFQETAAFNDHKTLKIALEPRMRAAAAAVQRLGTLVREGVAIPPTPTASATELEQAAVEAHQASMQLWSDLFDNEDIMLVSRLDKDLASRRYVLWSALAVLALLSGLLVLLVRNLRLFGKAIGGLRESTATLGRAVAQIDEHSNAHGQAITRQAAALQETQTTAQQIKQTSQVAAQSAVGILEVVERADTLGRAGESAVESSLHGLQEVRDQFAELAVKIRELSERTLQIGGITQTVKDLADQSNILALNAAIEAARSGEHGKGFSVVAREIRNLADQSIQATTQVQELLGSVGSAIR